MLKARRDFLRYAGYGAVAAGVLPPHATALSAGRPGLSHVFDVRSYGATGDGKTVDTPAINRAVQAASSAGGGRVYFGAGTYLCYSIRLQSKVALYLEQGAVILAGDTPPEGTTHGGYDAAGPGTPWESYQDFGHNHWRNSLIWGEDLHDVSVLGPGLIWGKGLSRGWETELPRAESPGVGNKAIALKNCHNVLLRDFSILQGGHFGVLATGVDNLTIDNLKIDTNRDGMDIDCCRNVRITNCSVNSPWDDGICPKSSYALGHARATENLTISNCYVTGMYEMGTLLDGTYRKFPAAARVPHVGRIKCGTESNGGFKNIAISNCVFEGCQGLALESEDGALLENISVTNITMRDIVGAPMFLRLGGRMRGPHGVPVGKLRRVLISNLVCSNASSKLASILSGVPGHSIEDVVIGNIYVQHQGGGTVEQAAIRPPELVAKYPDPGMFGPMPAQGFYLRHIRNLEMSHIEIAAMRPDHRPAFVLDDVRDADFFSVRAPRTGNAPLFALYDVDSFRVAFSHGVPDTALEHVDVKTL